MTLDDLIMKLRLLRRQGVAGDARVSFQHMDAGRYQLADEILDAQGDLQAVPQVVRLFGEQQE